MIAVMSRKTLIERVQSMHTQLPARQSPPNLPNFPDWFSQCHQGGWVGNDANQHHCVQLYNGVGTIDTERLLQLFRGGLIRSLIQGGQTLV